MGGAIAFEMACQLRRDGEEVALLALLDTTADLQGEGPRTSEQPEAALRELFFEDLLRATGQPMPPLEGKSPEARLRALEEASQAFPYPTLRRVFENNLRAAWNYEPPPYAGPVTLFVARESRWDHGWTSRAPGGLAMHEVPGDHYSMLTRPHVDALAARLEACLEEARAGITPGMSVGRTG
jgi:thioesterase domain-containing protein